MNIHDGHGQYGILLKIAYTHNNFNKRMVYVSHTWLVDASLLAHLMNINELAGQIIELSQKVIKLS